MKGYNFILPRNRDWQKGSAGKHPRPLKPPQDAVQRVLEDRWFHWGKDSHFDFSIFFQIGWQKKTNYKTISIVFFNWGGKKNKNNISVVFVFPAACLWGNLETLGSSWNQQEASRLAREAPHHPKGCRETFFEIGGHQIYKRNLIVKWWDKTEIKYTYRYWEKLVRVDL